MPATFAASIVTPVARRKFSKFVYLAPTVEVMCASAATTKVSEPLPAFTVPVVSTAPVVIVSAPSPPVTAIV